MYFQPRHQKGRRIPINLQDKIIIVLKKILDEKHIIKLSSCPDNYFISLHCSQLKEGSKI